MRNCEELGIVRNWDIGRTVVVIVGSSSAEVTAPTGARLQVEKVDGRRYSGQSQGQVRFDRFKVFSAMSKVFYSF